MNHGLAKDKKSLTFAYPNSLNHPQAIRLVSILEEACKRIGYKCKLIILPGKRGTAELVAGSIDGEMIRISHYGNNKPSLVRVEEHHSEGFFEAYSNKKISLNGWKSLKNKNYKVSYNRSTVLPSKKLPLYVKKENIGKVSSVAAGFSMLRFNRADIFVDSKSNIRAYKATKNYRTQSKTHLIYFVGVMSSVRGHIWLHKKHAKIALDLSRVLVDMKISRPELFYPVWKLQNK
jgi:hypothetical protein